MKDNVPDSIRSKARCLKDKYPTIYGLKIGEDYFILRPLSRGEFNIIVDLQKVLEGETDEFIFKTCVLHPEFTDKELDHLLAGTIPEIAKIVIDLSGFSSVDSLSTLIQNNRAVMDLADNQITVLLCKAFPHLTPDIVDEFDIYKITHYLALAEQILGVTLDLPNKKQKPKQKDGPINFGEDNKNLFKSEAGKFMPKIEPNIDKLHGGNVG